MTPHTHPYLFMGVYFALWALFIGGLLLASRRKR